MHEQVVFFDGGYQWEPGPNRQLQFRQPPTAAVSPSAVPPSGQDPGVKPAVYGVGKGLVCLGPIPWLSQAKSLA